MIRRCLDLRDTYVYRENIAPWEKVTEPGNTASEINSDPFHFDLVEATAVSFLLLVSNCLAAKRLYLNSPVVN